MGFAPQSMGSNCTRGRSRLYRLLVWACTLGFCALAATAQAAPPPSSVPPGYTLERRGTASWLYPTAAESEVDKLDALRKVAWAKLSQDLGTTLDPELDIRIGLNPDHMQQIAPDGRRLPGYASGVAFPREGLILLTMAEPERWIRPDLAQVLTHELAHVALQRAVGEHRVPHWLTEGLAIHEAGERSVQRIWTLWEGTVQGRLLTLEQLAASFPEEHRRQVDLAYAQAADLVGAMFAADQGATRFRSLIAGMRQGARFEDAVLSAYGVTLDRLEQRWRQQLSQRYGSSPTLLVGLSGLWALAAGLLVIGYVRVRRKHRRTLQRWAIEEAPLHTAATPPPPPPPPPPQATAQRTPADDVLDAWGDRQHREPGVPTVMHEGRSYTLH